MSSNKQNLRLAGAFAVLATLALAIGCRGFFVNPTVTSLAIGPSNLSLAPATSYQMIATATYSDGSQGDVTGKSVWTSSAPNVANFSAPGYLTAAALSSLSTLPGTTTVSASDGTVSSSTQTVNVCPVVQTLTFTMNSGTTSISVAGGTQVTFVASATFNGITGSQNVTNNVTWNISNTAVLPSISSGVGIVANNVAGQSTTVSATLCGTTSTSLSITASS